jgi:hypothetical protein
MPSSANPYDGLPASAFWKSGVVERPHYALDNIYRKKFQLRPEDRIATAGSCFAQHISRYLRANGFRILDVEPPPAWLPPALHARYGYSMYSARYGNIYTVAQLLQLARECLGQTAPDCAVWMKDGRYVDALRPAIEPEGYSSEAELRLHRKYHVSRVRALLSQMDVLIFTLGLTETWFHKKAGTIYPTCPGVIAGQFDDADHGFVNLNFVQMDATFGEFLACLKAMRAGEKLPRIILTVSPVPLTATASGQHVLAASTYSKAALRALAGHLADRHEFIDYFPSFEIVTNPAARGTFFNGNLRTVTSHGVGEVMKVFFAAHGGQGGPPKAPPPPAPEPSVARETADAQVQCEEAMLEAFANG